MFNLRHKNDFNVAKNVSNNFFNSNIRIIVVVEMFAHKNYIFQEKTVALKIFELGLKKFGDVTDYIRAYVDFMSHLNGTYITNIVVLLTHLII